MQDKVCLKGVFGCKYLLIDHGVTNLLQKKNMDCYCCGTGQFHITRNPEKDLPSQCSMYQEKSFPLQKEEAMVR